MEEHAVPIQFAKLQDDHLCYFVASTSRVLGRLLGTATATGTLKAPRVPALLWSLLAMQGAPKESAQTSQNRTRLRNLRSPAKSVYNF